MKSVTLIFLLLSLCIVSNAATITSTSSGGEWFSPETWQGKVVPTENDDVIIIGPLFSDSGGDSKCNNLTIQSSGEFYKETRIGGLKVFGKLINHGKIRNGVGNLSLLLYGDIENHGVFMPENAYIMAENKTIKISGTSPYSCGYAFECSNINQLVAESNLHIKNCHFRLNSSILNMGNYKLTYENDEYNSHKLTATSNEGKIVSNGEINISAQFYADIEGNVKLVGDGPMIYDSNRWIKGTVTIDTGKVVEASDHCSCKIYGDVINYGTVQDGNGRILFNVYGGDIFNYGEIICEYSDFYSNGEVCEILGIFQERINLHGGGEVEGGSFEFNSDSYFKRLDMVDNSELIINEEGKLRIDYFGFSNYTTGIPVNGTVLNKGIFITKNSDYRKNGIPGINMWHNVHSKGECDTLMYENYTGQPHPDFQNSASTWWRIDGNGPIGELEIHLNYNDENIEGMDEASLQAYIRPKDSTNFEPLSTPTNSELDTEKNVFKIGVDGSYLDRFGDIILTSDYPITSASVIVDLIGSKNIRVGPPNRYTVSLWNPSKYRMPEFLVELKGQEGVFVTGLVSTNIETGEKEEVDLKGENGEYHDEDLFVIAEGLAPGEYRTFDVLLKADMQGTETKSTQLAISFAAIAYWAVGSAASEIISSGMVNSCYEMWRPVPMNATNTQMAKSVIKNSLKGTNAKEVAIDVAKGEVISTGIKAVFKKAAWPAEVTYNVYQCLRNTVRGMKDYVNGGFKKERNLNKVFAVDPNEKIGPDGIGENGYMASTNPMTYTILFENKAEATAPAFKVVVVDTLDAEVFDVNSVQAIQMSHKIGEFTREENILKWEFEGIELEPNKEPPEGEGFVQFTVNPIADLPTGTELKNRASITFDLANPILTNTFINTLDFEEPLSENLKVVQNADGNLLNLSWDVNDYNGSGLKSSKIYVSKENGLWEMLAVSDSSNFNFKPQPYTNYRFRVISEDKVGNIEKEFSNIVELLTTEVFDITENSDFLISNIYPNPGEDNIHLNFYLPESGNYSVTLYDIMGRQVLTPINNKQGVQGINYENLSVQDLKSGFYYCSLKYNGIKRIAKIVIN